MKILEVIQQFQDANGVSDVELSRMLGMRSGSYVYNLKNGVSGANPLAADRMLALLVDAGILTSVEAQFEFWRGFVSLNKRTSSAA